jgi:hypothetical protein
VACAISHHGRNPAASAAAFSFTVAIPLLRPSVHHALFFARQYNKYYMVIMQPYRQNIPSTLESFGGATQYLCCRLFSVSDSIHTRLKDECADANDNESADISIEKGQQQPRKTLKYGRANRKITKSRQRNEDSIESEMNAESSQVFDKSKDDSRNDVDETNITTSPPPEGYTLPNGEFVFGSPHLGNPIRERYIRSLQKIHYPKTIHGWRALFRKSWEKYMWTFEGFLLKEKKRDEYGNVIRRKEGEETNDEESEVNDTKSLRDAATDVASGIANNVQQNITTLQKEAPQILRMGQQVTGISTKEELREWIRDQLKLGTACLTEFMAGYRKGRDEEIDRMLHAYFNELDGDNTKEVKHIGGDENRNNNESGSLDEKASEIQQHRMSGKRAWGRSERRRLKELSNRESNNTDQQSSNQF